MPKARKRKDSRFQTSMNKSVFLYGRPNKEKLKSLKRIQSLFIELVNRDIDLLLNETSVIMQIVKNDKKDPDMRRLEKAIRPDKVNSAFCQNAFDAAVTHLSNRYDDIRLDLLSEGMGIFARSKVLFAMSICGDTRKEMIDAMIQLKKPFYQECADFLRQISDIEFSDMQSEFMFRYDAKSMEYRIPTLRNVSVPLDQRLMRIEKSVDISMPYVITISDPENFGKRILVPIDTSTHSLHKIQSNKMASTVMMQIRKDKLRIGWSYEVKRSQPSTSEYIGVDTGITDTFYTSDGRAIGSMSNVLAFYRKEVEPAFAGLSDLRNKKRDIKYYLRHHELSEDVRRSLIQKMDRLEHMIQTMDAPYRKKRRYYNELDHEIKSSIDGYIEGISKDTLTVIEKLDIKEFQKSRRVNGLFSTFARGQLHQKLIQTLNWKGYDFIEVVPDYTSKVCPLCNNLDPDNRDRKQFRCTCCGYINDADYVASVNIRSRAYDKDIIALSDKYKYQHWNLQRSLKELYAERHMVYQQAASV